MTCVLLFQSVHQVMRGEKLLKARGVTVNLVPVPREISSECGVAIEVAFESREEALRLVQESGIVLAGHYHRNEEGRFERGF
jgi:hypothetical protein